MKDEYGNRCRSTNSRHRFANGPNSQLANNPAIERHYTPDRATMLAALRVVLGLPKAPPEWLKELS